MGEIELAEGMEKDLDNRPEVLEDQYIRGVSE
jgi:hypothetical protein